MANKNVNILLTLKDKFTPKLKGTTAEIKKQKAQINASSKVLNQWGNTANTKFKSVLKSAGKLSATILTLGVPSLWLGLPALHGRPLKDSTRPRKQRLNWKPS